MTIRRRDVFVLGGIVTAIYGLRALPWEQLAGRSLTYVEIEDVPPFRRLKSEGQTSSAAVALIGLDGPSDDAEARHARMEAMRADPCPALFGTDLPTGVVPIAYFSEFRCPFCRALEQDLDDLLADDRAAYRLVQHELPIFGPASELAARASVAAARQGRQQDLRRRFMRTPLVANESSILRVASDLDLNVEQLAIDMASPETQAELDQTRALADLFGFLGTPGLVIGRTVLNGAIPVSMLRQIAKDEGILPLPVC
ncbi:DsbA family protein [Paracoccus actinidiae]|uniref:DsbA family protein n=1 Tax=Paracoccus actinidiae TaxID=3064531 RepID=UPI0027D31B46|nr:DsbA family protein [Paracoccus sp. M09]